MASPEALAKLRAVLDYMPEEAARLLPGDDAAYYDALTRRLHRTIAVKSMVRRRVLVQVPEAEDFDEPDAPAYLPPAPIEEPAPLYETHVADAPLEQRAEEAGWAVAEAHDAEPEAPAYEPPPEAVWDDARTEDVSVIEAVGEGPDVEPEAPAVGEAGDDDDFDMVHRAGESMDVAPVEPEMSLSEAEWKKLDSPDVPEEEALAPIEAGEELAPPERAPEEGEAFEEVGVGATLAEEAPMPTTRTEIVARPASRLRPVPQEVAIPEAEPLAEFEVEEEAEIEAPEEFEVLEETESVGEELGEGPYEVNEYTLFKRETLMKNGRRRSSYFFSTEPSVEGAQPSPLPDDHEVIVNRDTGVPVIRKAAARTLPIIEIEGIGPVMAERLDHVGVRTTKDLLHVDLRQLSEDTGISDRLLGNFRAMADLLQLPGLYPDQAAALVYAGCRSLADLNKATPVELARQVNQAAKDHQLKLRGKMAAARIKGWQGKINNLELVRD
jgi:hypothetical protein